MAETRATAAAVEYPAAAAAVAAALVAAAESPVAAAVSPAAEFPAGVAEPPAGVVCLAAAADALAEGGWMPAGVVAAGGLEAAAEQHSCRNRRGSCKPRRSLRQLQTPVSLLGACHDPYVELGSLDFVQEL